MSTVYWTVRLIPRIAPEQRHLAIQCSEGQSCRLEGVGERQVL
jgi:hypothetical protein